MLLDRYTSAKWYVDQSKRLLQREYLTDCDTENDVICQVDAAGLYNNELQKEFTATLKYNKDIIRFINFALQSLKDAPDGEKLYTIIDVSPQMQTMLRSNLRLPNLKRSSSPLTETS